MCVSVCRLFSIGKDKCRKFKQNQIIFCIHPWIVEVARTFDFAEDRLRERSSLPSTFYVLTRVIFSLVLLLKGVIEHKPMPMLINTAGLFSPNFTHSLSHIFDNFDLLNFLFTLFRARLFVKKKKQYLNVHFPEMLRFPCGSDVGHVSPGVRRILVLVCLLYTSRCV